MIWNKLPSFSGKNVKFNGTLSLKKILKKRHRVHSQQRSWPETAGEQESAIFRRTIAISSWTMSTEFRSYFSPPPPFFFSRENDCNRYLFGGRRSHTTVRRFAMEYFSSVIVCSCLHTPFLFAFFVQVMMDISTDQAGPGLHYLLFDREYLDLFFWRLQNYIPRGRFLSATSTSWI